MALNRIAKELNSIDNNPELCCIVDLPNEDDLFNWILVISGFGDESPWKDGKFKVALSIP